MNELDYADVDRAAAARGLRVTAIYHSHVGLGAYFSAEDRGFAADIDFPFPDADHFVISVFEGKVRGQGVFRREGPTGEFAGWPVVPEHA
jgi:proteasome lid subunit RPN8/RPN11